jgi:hypothetical protein
MHGVITIMKWEIYMIAYEENQCYGIAYNLKHSVQWIRNEDGSIELFSGLVGADFYKELEGFLEKEEKHIKEGKYAFSMDRIRTASGLLVDHNLRKKMYGIGDR